MPERCGCWRSVSRSWCGTSGNRRADPEHMRRFGEGLAEAPRALGRYFAAYVFVAALPYTRAYHRERGIPAETTRHTLADLGRNMASHRRRHGTGGVRARGGWCTTSGESCTSWGGCSSNEPRSGSAPRRYCGRPGWTRCRASPAEPARPRLPRAADTGRLRPLARPGQGVLPPALSRGAVPCRDVPLLAPRPAAEAVPGGRLQHRPVPGTLPGGSGHRARRRGTCPLRLREPLPAGRGAAAAHLAGTGRRGPPARGRPLVHRARLVPVLTVGPVHSVG